MIVFGWSFIIFHGELAFYQRRVDTMETQFKALEGVLFDVVHASLAERDYVAVCDGLEAATGTADVAFLQAEVVGLMERIEKMKVSYRNALLNRLDLCRYCPRCSDGMAVAALV